MLLVQCISHIYSVYHHIRKQARQYMSVYLVPVFSKPVEEFEAHLILVSRVHYWLGGATGIPCAVGALWRQGHRCRLLEACDRGRQESKSKNRNFCLT